MNGIIERKLRGTLGVLFAALALATAGCAQSAPDEADEEGDVDTAHQLLAPLPHEHNPVGGAPLPDNSAGEDGEDQDPTPIPWVPVANDDDGDPDPGDNLFTKSVSSAPSGGHHDH